MSVMVKVMSDNEKAIAYLAVEVESGSEITGLSKIDAERVAEFARHTLGSPAVVRPSGPAWKKARLYSVVS